MLKNFMLKFLRLRRFFKPASLLHSLDVKLHEVRSKSAWFSPCSLGALCVGSRSHAADGDIVQLNITRNSKAKSNLYNDLRNISKTNAYPHPPGSLTMYVLIKDLQRSGVHVCANKGLSGSHFRKSHKFKILNSRRRQQISQRRSHQLVTK
jgi:hypothetical protein